MPSRTHLANRTERETGRLRVCVHVHVSYCAYVKVFQWVPYVWMKSNEGCEEKHVFSSLFLSLPPPSSPISILSWLRMNIRTWLQINSDCSFMTVILDGLTVKASSCVSLTRKNTHRCHWAKVNSRALIYENVLRFVSMSLCSIHIRCWVLKKTKKKNDYKYGRHERPKWDQSISTAFYW